MSNWLDYVLDVLANDPYEINQIAGRLRKPSPELVTAISKELSCPASDGAEFLWELLDFETVKNLGYVHPTDNKTRRFSVSFKEGYSGIVDSHLAEVSKAFPAAVFLLEYFDLQSSYSGKSVIRQGEIVRSIFDGCQKAQAVDWALLDIFAPFRAEHETGLPFCGLWKEWLKDISAVAHRLLEESEPGLTSKQETQRDMKLFSPGDNPWASRLIA